MDSLGLTRVTEGRLCWVVHLDCLVVSDGGNLPGALSIACKAALADARIPRATVAAEAMTPSLTPSLTQSLAEGGWVPPEVEIDDDPASGTRLDCRRLPLLTTALWCPGLESMNHGLESLNHGLESRGRCVVDATAAEESLAGTHAGTEGGTLLVICLPPGTGHAPGVTKRGGGGFPASAVAAAQATGAAAGRALHAAVDGRLAALRVESEAAA